MKRNRKPAAETCLGDQPFADLRDRIRRRSICLPACAVPAPVSRDAPPPDPEDEHRLFRDAMADVTPIARPARPVAAPVPAPGPEEAPRDEESLCRLRALVECGSGFVVSDTPEYMEGRGPRVGPEVVRRLHRGDFSIQDHVDLHGLNVREAREAVERFLSRALRERKRAVLIVHGRGLSSPVEPVLKKNVRHWLTGGPMRKWVMAFASARRCDGGAGATYVLLRHRPATKRERKRKARCAARC